MLSQMSSINAALLLPLMKRLHCRCYMSLLDYFHLLLSAIVTLQTFDPQVCQSNVTHASVFSHKLCSDIKKIR